jgi:hypothetical protein
MVDGTEILPDTWYRLDPKTKEFKDGIISNLFKSIQGLFENKY